MNPQLQADSTLAYVIEEARRSGLVESIRLFGSRARGTQKERSDYDLAITFKEVATPEQRARFLLDLTERSPTLYKLDLVELDQVTDPDFRRKILGEGIELC